MKPNYDRSKTISRKTTKNYHSRADDPLLSKFADISVLSFNKRTKSHNCTLKICLTPPIGL